MIRTFIYLAEIGIVVALAVWLADHPGKVMIEWGGWRIDTSVGVLGLAILAFVVAVVLLFRLFRALRGAPAALARRRRERRRVRGYQALTQGMVAVAAGDADEASRHARRANALLNDPPLTMLLSAQAAQIEGEDEAAGRYFRAMLERPEMEFLGLRGLLMQATRAGDRAQALEYARRAHELRPKTPWVLTTLFDLQVRAGEWAAASATLDEAVRRRVVPAAQGRREKAVVLAERARAEDAEAKRDQALSHAREALDLAPDFMPAAALLARLHVRDGAPRKAARVVEDEWTRSPHPDLLDLYREAMAPADELAWFREVQKLAGRKPEHSESRLALARAALEARLWGEARRALDGLGGDRPPAIACRLMARLEEGEHADMEAARAWLARAAEAPQDAAWHCRACGATHAAWAPLCARCDAFDSLEWREADRPVLLPPPREAAAAAPGTALTLREAAAPPAAAAGAG